MYIGTLTLSLLLAVFGAVLLAVVLGNQLARPSLLLGRRREPGGRAATCGPRLALHRQRRTRWPHPLHLPP